MTRWTRPGGRLNDRMDRCADRENLAYREGRDEAAQFWGAMYERFVAQFDESGYCPGCLRETPGCGCW